MNDYDDWSLNLDYLWYHHTFTKSFHATGLQTFTAAGFTNTYAYAPDGLSFSSMKFKDTNHYNEMNLYAERPFYFGKRVIFGTAAGLKGIWWTLDSHQSFVQNAGFLGSTVSGLPFVQTSKQEQWAIGFTSMIDGSLLLDYGFSLIGKAQIGLVYVNFTKLDQVINQVGQPLAITKDSSKSAQNITPYGEGAIGLAWGSYFSCDRYRFDLSATYDVTAFNASAGTGVGITTGLVFQGLTVHGKLDF
jgi:hypothetical protein